MGELNKFLEAEEAELEASVLFQEKKQLKKSILMEGVEQILDLDYDDQEGSEQSSDNELE